MTENLAETFKQALRKTAGGVYAITANDGVQRTGLVVIPLIPVSTDPPELLISVNRDSSSWPVLQKAGRFGVNMLSDEQRQCAENFAGMGGVKGAQRYEGEEWSQTPGGVWLSRNALAVFACDVQEVIPHGGNALVIGRVTFVDAPSTRSNLIHCQGKFGEFAPF